MDNLSLPTKTSISVPEMQKMLELGKTEAYWLVKKHYFKTVSAAGRLRILIDSFEEWYANQFTYSKVDGPAPGAGLQETAMTIEDMAQMLDMTPGSVMELLGKINLERKTVCGRHLIVKSSFERWYQSQSFYRTVADREADKLKHGETITMPEVAHMLGIKRSTVYGMVKAGRFETIKTARTTLIKRESFDRWYAGQSKYKITEVE